MKILARAWFMGDLQFFSLGGKTAAKRLRENRFSLWIDGECMGIYSRLRDALRRWRSIRNRFGGSISAWIDDVDCKLSRKIQGFGFITRAMQDNGCKVQFFSGGDV